MITEKVGIKENRLVLDDITLIDPELKRIMKSFVLDNEYEIQFPIEVCTEGTAADIRVRKIALYEEIFEVVVNRIRRILDNT